MASSKVLKQVQAIDSTIEAALKRIVELEDDLAKMKKSGNHKSDTLKRKRAEIDALKGALGAVLERGALLVQISESGLNAVRAAIRRL